MISVITLTYNNYDELICTINSLEGVPNIEHIIINGGTCAKTLNFLKSYHGISISEPDEGISDGFNKGIALSRGELVLFLNSGDTLVDKKYPLEAEKFFKKEKKLGIIHADLIFGDHLIGDIRLAALKKTELSDVSLGRGMPYHHQTMIFRKKLFDEFGNFDLNFKISMDYEWLCRFDRSQQYTVKYWNKSAPARMEGGGVSQKKEYLQIFETFLSLIKNKKLTLKNLNGLIKRVTNYTFRVALERLNISKLVGLIKYHKFSKYIEFIDRLFFFGLNGALLHKNPTGLSRYSQELLSILLNKMQSALVYTQLEELLNRFPDQARAVGPNFQNPANTTSNSKRMLWEQTGLRWHLYKDRRELHFSPIAEGVLFPPCPQVITVHDALPLYDTTFMPRWVPYYQYVLPLLIRQSTATVCISEFTRQELLRLDPKLPQHKLRVIPPGVNQERFFPGNPEAAFKRWGLQGYLLMVGEGRPYKNPEVVVRALAELKQAVPLAICGRMPEHERARVEQIAREAGVLEQIRWLGYVSDAELRDLYTGALAFVFPSRYEGFGLPTLEAMSCGAPVLSSNAASLPEAGGSAALYFSPDNPSALAELIHLLHTEPERRELMREAGLRHAEKFTWERSAKQHLELFEEALYARY